jgi:hypothetical protein
LRGKGELDGRADDAIIFFFFFLSRLLNDIDKHSIWPEAWRMTGESSLFPSSLIRILTDEVKINRLAMEL